MVRQPHLYVSPCCNRPAFAIIAIILAFSRLRSMLSPWAPFLAAPAIQTPAAAAAPAPAFTPPHNQQSPTGLGRHLLQTTTYPRTHYTLRPVQTSRILAGRPAAQPPAPLPPIQRDPAGSRVEASAVHRPNPTLEATCW
jgi:hypothetical protein